LTLPGVNAHRLRFVSDDGGLLGNLPRTRPGTRSEKRQSGAAKPGRPEDEPAAAGPGEGSSDPVGDALRAAGRTAETGARVAQALAREALRRLPRP
jgi:hypothetical protein